MSERATNKGRQPSNNLTALKVKKETRQGIHADGNGLYLKIDRSGAKRWLQRIYIKGKRTDLGLGSVSTVTLAEARLEAINNKKLARAGGDPLEEKRKQNAIPTFKEAAYKVFELNKPTWSNPKHAQQWINTLEKYVFPTLGNKIVDSLSSADILSILSPIWTTKPETATRVKQRINKVLEWCVVQGYRSDNPCLAISRGLPKVSNQVKHHKSLPFDEVANAIHTINNTGASIVTKMAFEFLVLNASRSGEVRGARWSEINGDVWEIPPERMKTKKAHRLPLSKRSMEILKTMEQIKDESGLVFSRNGKQLTDVAISKLLKDNNIGAVPHGFRSSFRVWASEKTNYPHQVCEFALAHVISDKAEAAYQRSDLFDKRRGLMESWSQYLAQERAKVIPLNATHN